MTTWDMTRVYASLDYERRKPVGERTLTEQILALLRALGW